MQNCVQASLKDEDSARRGYTDKSDKRSFEMELNVNSPAYYTDKYGVDDKVYNFFKKVRSFFSDKEYSDTLHTVGVLPMVAPQELYESGQYKESVLLINNQSCAIISFRIDFNEYCNADSYQKIDLTKELILNAMKKIKSKTKFNYEAFENDFNQSEADLQS